MTIDIALVKQYLADVVLENYGLRLQLAEIQQRQTELQQQIETLTKEQTSPAPADKP